MILYGQLFFQRIMELLESIKKNSLTRHLVTFLVASFAFSLLILFFEFLISKLIEETTFFVVGKALASGSLADAKMPPDFYLVFLLFGGKNCIHSTFTATAQLLFQLNHNSGLYFIILVTLSQ